MDAPLTEALTRVGCCDVFVPYSGFHLLTVSVCAVLIATPSLVGRRLHTKNAEANMRWALAIAALCYWFSYHAWSSRNGVDYIDGLPLQVCDLNGLVAPLALLTLSRWLRATLYFWAFTLTTQAFIQPFSTDGPALLGFWEFWTAHTIILACAVYDLAALGFRPDQSDLVRAYVVSAVYIVVILPVNLLLGSNYGFVGNPPPEVRIPPLVEAFGSWPGRAAIIIGLAATGFVVVLSPWLVAERLRRVRLPSMKRH